MKKLGIYLGVFLFSILCFELWLRISPYSGGQAVTCYHEGIGFWHKANFSSFQNRSCYRVPFEFDERGRAVNLHHNEGKPNVAMLGNSYLEALMVNLEAKLNNQLTQLVPQYNFWNYGLGGTLAPHQYLVYLHEVRQEKPDVVLSFLHYPVDFFIKPPVSRSKRARFDIEFSDEGYYYIYKRDFDWLEQARDLLGDTEFYFLLVSSVQYVKELFRDEGPSRNMLKAQGSARRPRPLFTEKEKEQIDLFLKQFKNLGEQDGFKFIPVIYECVSGRAEVIKKSLAKHNIEAIFITDFIKSIPYEDRTFPCDGHWNSYTNRRLANYLSNKLSALF
ncbi:MAG: hypothetical protein GY941_21345 [Planctomycetes bacterium]|nr:hypothetical protein [Planctomycetota bacterium]